MITLAENALSRIRLIDTVFYYRSGEFYILEENSKKKQLYDKFLSAY